VYEILISIIAVPTEIQTETSRNSEGLPYQRNCSVRYFSSSIEGEFWEILSIRKNCPLADAAKQKVTVNVLMSILQTSYQA